MRHTRKLNVLAVALTGSVLALAGAAPAAAQPLPADATPSKPTGCTAKERSDVLQEMKQTVLKTIPPRIESLDQAIQPGGPLAGWRLAHRHAVLAGAGAVAVDNANANTKFPQPQLVLYAPASGLDGSRGPYKLVGWGYFVPYQEAARAPQQRCVAEDEWLVHEAGWHTMDGGMVLTPGATSEPSHPPANRYFWHPRTWDLHVWLTGSGAPTISDANPGAPAGGVVLPRDAFFHVVDGRRYPPRTASR